MMVQSAAKYELWAIGRPYELQSIDEPAVIVLLFFQLPFLATELSFPSHIKPYENSKTSVLP
jgi:hypothetical protein